MRENGALLGGVDVGGTSIKTAVVTADGTVKGRAKRETEAAKGTATLIENIEESLREACSDAGVKENELGGAGVAVAGPVDRPRGVVMSAVNLGWDDYPLGNTLQERLGIRVTVENDVTAAVWGERLAGAGRGKADLLGVWVGTGIGGGLVLNGRLYTGEHHTAGEVGRGIVFPWAPPGQGTLDHVCSRKGMVDTLVRLIRSGRESSLSDAAKEAEPSIGARDLAKAWKAGDPLVTEVVEHSARVLGTAIGGIVTLLSLGRVVLGGGVTERLGGRWVRLVRKAVRRTVYPDELQACEIVESELGRDAGPIGAAMLAKQEQG